MISKAQKKKKIKYIPEEKQEVQGDNETTTTFKYIGPNLTHINRFTARQLRRNPVIQLAPEPAVPPMPW